MTRVSIADIILLGKVVTDAEYEVLEPAGVVAGAKRRVLREAETEPTKHAVVKDEAPE